MVTLVLQKARKVVQDTITPEFVDAAIRAQDEYTSESLLGWELSRDSVRVEGTHMKYGVDTHNPQEADLQCAVVSAVRGDEGASINPAVIAVSQMFKMFDSAAAGKPDISVRPEGGIYEGFRVIAPSNERLDEFFSDVDLTPEYYNNSMPY